MAAKLRDKVKMPAPKMDEEEVDVMELGEEESEMLPDESATPLADVSDEELLEELKARGLGIDSLEKRDAEVEVPEDEDELGLDL